MVNWKTTVTGIAAIIIAGLVTLKYLTAEQGAVITGLIVGVLALVSKDFNVTGGSIPQASPPGVATKSDALGVNDAVDALKKLGPITLSESFAKSNAQAIIAAPPVSPVDVVLTK